MKNKTPNACEAAIKNTLKYRSIFKYSLSKYQLKNLLISSQKFNEKHFSDELNRLVKKGDVKSRGERYYSTGFKPVDWARRAKQSSELIEQAISTSEVLSTIPWIKMLSVTGSVAAYGADEDSDIDIFIVCTHNRTWLTRFFTWVLLNALGKYRTDKNPRRKICPNIFVDENSMTWPKDKRSVYIAHEIVMMHPLINRDETYFGFLRANQWIFDYFRNFNVVLALKEGKKKKQSWLVDLLERVLFRFQVVYMKRKKTTEITQRNLIHFNRDDWSSKIIAKYSNLVREVDEHSL